MSVNSKCYRHDITGDEPPIRQFSSPSQLNQPDNRSLDDIVDEIKKTPMDSIKVPTYEELFDE